MTDWQIARRALMLLLRVETVQLLSPTKTVETIHKAFQNVTMDPAGGADSCMAHAEISGALEYALQELRRNHQSLSSPH